MKSQYVMSRNTGAPEVHSAKVAVKPARRGPSELTKSWANHFSNHQYSLEAVSELVVGAPSEKRLVKH